MTRGVRSMYASSMLAFSERVSVACGECDCEYSEEGWKTVESQRNTTQRIDVI